MRTRFVALAAIALAHPARGLLKEQDAARYVGTWQGSLNVGLMKRRPGLAVTRDSSGALSGYMTSIDQGSAVIPGRRRAAGRFARGDDAAGERTLQWRVVGTLRFPARHVPPGRRPAAGVRARPGVLRRTARRRSRSHHSRTRRATCSSSRFPVCGSPARLRRQRHGSVPRGGVFTGSGAQNRDEELMGHKPFLVIADYLARHGIASLRTDDRGTASSTGNFASATSADFADDAEAALRFLRAQPKINPSRVGIIGHSEAASSRPWLPRATTTLPSWCCSPDRASAADPSCCSSSISSGQRRAFPPAGTRRTLQPKTVCVDSRWWGFRGVAQRLRPAIDEAVAFSRWNDDVIRYERH